MLNQSKMAPGSFVTVCKEDEVHEGSMFGVTVTGNPILLSKIGGKIYATDAICSHYNGYLPRGELKDRNVICPVHKAEFDVATGKVAKNVPWLIKSATHKEAAVCTQLQKVRLKV